MQYGGGECRYLETNLEIHNGSMGGTEIRRGQEEVNYLFLVKMKYNSLFWKKKKKSNSSSQGPKFPEKIQPQMSVSSESNFYHPYS